jgi:hypothetical protein
MEGRGACVAVEKKRRAHFNSGPTVTRGLSLPLGHDHGT